MASISASSSHPIKTAAEARAAVGVSGTASTSASSGRNPRVAAALQDLCRIKNLGPNVAESAVLWRALSGIHPQVAIDGIEKMQRYPLWRWGRVKNPAGFVIAKLLDIARDLTSKQNAVPGIPPPSLVIDAPPSSLVAAEQLPGSQQPEGITAEVWDLMMQLCSERSMQWRDLESKVNLIPWRRLCYFTLQNHLYQFLHEVSDSCYEKHGLLSKTWAPMLSRFQTKRTKHPGL